MSLTPRDLERLAGVHPHLAQVVQAAAAYSPVRFTVLEGLRSLQAQVENIAAGTSLTMDSRHLTGHAVDLGVLDQNGVLTWGWPWYAKFAVHMKAAGALCGVPLEWGGDWKDLKDGPHWQLPRKLYPASPPDPPVTREV